MVEGSRQVGAEVRLYSMQGVNCLSLLITRRLHEAPQGFTGCLEAHRAVMSPSAGRGAGDARAEPEQGRPSQGRAPSCATS